MSDLSNGVTTALCSREHVVRSHLQIDAPRGGEGEGEGWRSGSTVIDEREKDVDGSEAVFLFFLFFPFLSLSLAGWIVARHGRPRGVERTSKIKIPWQSFPSRLSAYVSLGVHVDQP